MIGGVIDRLPSETGDRVRAIYFDFESIRKDVTDAAWRATMPDRYPRAMLALKYDLSEINEDDMTIEELMHATVGDVTVEDLYNDVDEAVYGMCADGLLRTTHGYDEMLTVIEEHGYDRQRVRNGWTVFDTTYTLGSDTGDMWVAVNDNHVAYIIGGVDELYSGNVIPRNDQVDQFMETYIAMLAGDDQSMSLSTTNPYARTIEGVFTGGTRDWDSLLFTVANESEIDAAQRTGERPVQAGGNTVDYDHESKFYREYRMFDDGEMEQTELKRLAIRT